MHKLIGGPPYQYQVEFLPSHTTSFIHFTDLELIAAVKACYYRRTFLSLDKAANIPTEQFVDTAEDDEALALAGKKLKMQKFTLSNKWKFTHVNYSNIIAV